MSDTVLLTSELLGSYETRLRSAGVLVDEAPAPRSRTDQDEITRPLGLVLSEEARLWWGWHDGSSGWWRGNCLGFCGDGFTSLERAVKLATELRGVAEEFTEEVDEAGELLDRAWLPFAETRYAITIDCGDDPGAPSPVRNIAFEDWSSVRQVVAPSLGTLVTWWCEAIDNGGWVWDTAASEWVTDKERMNPELVKVGTW